MSALALEPPGSGERASRGLPWSYCRGGDVVDVKVGYRCNNRCVHCAVEWVRQGLIEDRKRADLTTEEVERLVDEATAAGAAGVVLTGGEATIRRDFPRLLRHVAGRGLRCIVQTHGGAFARQVLVDRIADIGDVSFVVALHGSSAAVHDRIAGRAGSFEETCAGIRNLTAAGKVVLVKIVILRLNQGEVVPVARLARSLGAAEFCVAFPYGVGEQLALVRRYRALAHELRSVCAYADGEQLHLSFETMPYCVLPDLPSFWQRNCDLEALRRGRPCRLPAATADRAHWDELRPGMKEKPPACRACVFDPMCEGVWREYVAAFGVEELQPVGPRAVAEFLLESAAAEPGAPI